MNSRLSELATAFVALSLALVIGFCGAPKAYAAVAETQTQEGGAAAPAPTKQAGCRFEKVMLLPAELDSGADAEFTGVPVPGRLAMAAKLTKNVAEVLAEKGLLAQRPGPGVARLKLILSRLEMARTGASAALPPAPFPLPPGLPTEGPGQTVIGTASVTAELTDSQTEETLATFRTKETAKGDLLDALPKAIDKVVQAIGDRLDQSAEARLSKRITE